MILVVIDRLQATEEGQDQRGQEFGLPMERGCLLILRGRQLLLLRIYDEVGHWDEGRFHC